MAFSAEAVQNGALTSHGVQGQHMNSVVGVGGQTGEDDGSQGASAHLAGGAIDEVPPLLEQSYRLRYQVYCLERRFLPAEHYPSGRELDRFDPHALHVGAVSPSGELVGTARAVRPSKMGLPVFEYCTPFLHETEFYPANPLLVEVGRLAIDRRFLRRQREAVSGVATVSPPDRPRLLRGRRQRRVGTDVLMTVLAALYQETRRIGTSHWLAAMEESLSSLLIEQGLPFRPFGPPGNYYGSVVPHQMSLQELETMIRSDRYPGLEGFLASAQPPPGIQPVGRADAEPEHTPRPKTRHAGTSR
jgi:N-acyl amino acid synthase of PEP-CTERM/exosortase system